MKFKVGDRVRFKNKTNIKSIDEGVIISIDKDSGMLPYLVLCDNSIKFWVNERAIEFAPKHKKEKRQVTYNTLNGETTLKTEFGNKATISVSKCMEDDTFDLEKGVMLCLLREKGITYNDIEQLCKSAKEEVKTKFKVGDIVEIVNRGSIYSSYIDWFDETDNSKLKDKYKEHIYPTYKEYVVVGFGMHKWPIYGMVYAIQDIEGKVFLFEGKGIKKANLGGK